MRERNQDPLTFVANQHMTPPHCNTYPSSYNNPQLQQQFSPSQQGSIQPNQHYSSHYPSQTKFNHSSISSSHTFQSHMNHQTSTVSQVIPQVAYQSPQAPTQLITESPFVNSSFVVPVFSPGDDPITCLNKAMAFLTAVASSRGNTTSGQERVVKCYNFQGEGNMATQCTQPKRLRNAAWYKEKGMLAEAQEAGQILDEEQLAFLADPRIPAGQAQTIIPYNAVFQTEDLDTYDFDCDDLSNTQAVLMANISNYGSDVILEVSNSKTYLNDMENQSVHALQDFKQSPVMGFTDNERIKPTLYDGTVIYEKHVAMPVIDDVETLILEEESRSKMSEKTKDPEVIAKKISHKPIDYEKLNRLTDDFEKRFTPQQELSAEQAFWLRISNPTIESSLPHVRMEVPSKLPKVSLVNESLKKLKFQLAQFNSVVKKRTTPNALTEEKSTVDNIAQISSATTVALGMFKLDLEPLAPKLVHNRESYSYYLKHTQEQADILQGIVEQAKAQQTLDNALDISCKHAKEFRSYLFMLETLVPVQLNLVTQRTKPSCNTKNNMISQPSSSKKINKVEDQLRSVKTRKNNKSHVKKVKCDDHVMRSMSNANSVSINNAPVKNYVNDVKSGCLCAIYGNHSQLVNFVSKFLGTVRFRNDKIARIIWYGDYQLGNVIISRVYYVEGIGHNLFSVGQFCDADLEIEFWKNTCFIRNLEGVDLLSRSHGTNLYIISLDDMLKSSLICLLYKASETKSWLWHRRLSHLNFDTLNKLAKDGLTRGIPRLKFQKDHLCSACALGKSKKFSHQPKPEDTNQKKLYILHMDLCGPMHVVSINGKRYILVIVDDYSRFTWHQTSVARTPQRNGVVERRNRTLVEADRTMLIFFKALLFLWAEAIITACYTQNRSLLHLRYNKTPYELMQNKKPDFLHIFGSLCYPTNDNEDLGKFDVKADIEIFVGYAPAKKAFIIYNKRTRIIFETIHVTFDELTAMDSKQFSSRPGLHFMTPATPTAVPRAEVLADSPVSISISQDAPSTSIPSLQEQQHSQIISQGSSSNVIKIHTLFEHLGRWTKDHLIANVINDPSRFVSTRKQLETDAMWCYFDAFLTSVEPKNFKQVMTEPLWIDAMQEEIHEFERLKSKYASKIVKKYGLNSTDSIDTPMIENKKLDEDLQGKPVDVTLYRGMIKSLMYLTANRPDLNYDDTDMSLTAYADADHAGCQDTRHNTSGSAQFLDDKLVSWSSKKQTAISSTEAEYIALSGC
uniref:Retrovirus-related Pol polyprotein from transposon TNT 1-94 n=1 Tax=Tanacetum cinerariifolium TaxID=118510 RepID=A0A6L2NVX0_TANCI|nr:retrovirus-related Pol polyprotein from transposon TNT 1-94 [Tanacetum cinerariifolium]